MPGFDPDQPRDEKGQWTDAGPAIKAAASTQGKLFELPEPTPLELLKAGKFNEVKVMNTTEAKAAIEKYKDTLTEDELYYVSEYTGTGYWPLNSALRQGREADEDSVNNLDSFLKDAPKFIGETYRGLSFNSPDGYASYKNDLTDDSIIADLAYGSTSVKENFVDGFIKYSGSYRIKLVVSGKSGVYLNGLSNHEEEEEVLFPRETKFRVRQVEEVNMTGGVKHLTAYLEEIT